jgi:hypothetical protein
MGYPNKRLKVRRHNDHMRLHAATILVGVRYSQWSLPHQGRVVHGYEIIMPGWDYWPYQNSLAGAVRLAAKFMGIK